MCVALACVNSPQRMRQRYAYGSNIVAVRCGWEYCMSEQWRITNCGIQSNLESERDVSLTLNMTNGIFGGAVLTAL